MFSDCHVHCRADADGGRVLEAMDAVQMERIVLLAPAMKESNEALSESVDIITGICSADPSRLLGFAWIEPPMSGAVDHVRKAADNGLRGFKMIPDHWYPYEERFFPVYEAIQETRLPIIFHSGILYGNADSSRFCRPVFYEVMLHFPKVKFALAHISWPWTDECIAVAGRMRAAVDYEGDRSQMYIDTTRGTPDYYRVDALEKALRFCGPSRLIYGSDDRAPGDLTRARLGVDKDRAIICDQLGYSQDDFHRIAVENLGDFLRPFE
jgi:predicted TIM-barrel fold metal-dependent hydrolase